MDQISALNVVFVAYAVLAGLVGLAYLYIGVATGAREADEVTQVDEDLAELQELRGYAATGYWMDEYDACISVIDEEADAALAKQGVAKCG